MSPALETLPPEILFHILSFTWPFQCSFGLSEHSNPLVPIANTSRHLLSVVEEYTRSLLKQHANRTFKGTKSKGNKGPIIAWIKWLGSHCQVCKKNSRRKAILDPGLTCCAACDRKEFEKISMTAAIANHYLSKLDLFTPNELHPNLPPLKFGTYSVMGGISVMISLPDVLARKELILGMLGENNTRNHLRRIAAHDRIMEAMGIGIQYGEWRITTRFQWDEGSKVKKVLRTKESREQYVKESLEKEWKYMGMNGSSVGSAVKPH